MHLKKFTALVLLILLAGCGYYNPYVARSDSKPITLHRSMWKNHTNDIRLEQPFTGVIRKGKIVGCIIKIRF